VEVVAIDLLASGLPVNKPDSAFEEPPSPAEPDAKGLPPASALQEKYGTSAPADRFNRDQRLGHRRHAR
jgi:hypothetical protein